MKAKWFAFFALACLALPAVAQNAPNAAAPSTKKDKDSYSIGVQFAALLKRQGVDVNADVLAKGLKDALAGTKLAMTDQEISATLDALAQEVNARQGQLQAAAADNNKKAGEAFLAANKKKDGVVTLPSGLQYKVIKAGQGKKPIEDDTITCQYRGTLIDGTEFDSSYKAGQPATFLVKGLIPGFKEALQQMPVGATFQFFIPADLAYGEAGAGDAVGPNETLIFQVELISIEAKGAPAAH
jgi:FKBP-type peptidyl-prolyl cis-trans isomerase FklB